MKLRHLDDGRSLADTQTMAALTARPPAAVRRYCTRELLGYDVTTCTRQLAGTPDPVTLSARQAQQYLGIPANTVYQWAYRRRLHSCDHDERGRPLYDVDDLMRLKEHA